MLHLFFRCLNFDFYFRLNFCLLIRNTSEIFILATFLFSTHRKKIIYIFYQKITNIQFIIFSVISKIVKILEMSKIFITYKMLFCNVKTCKTFQNVYCINKIAFQ
ncbi:hypothetical protein EDEG_02162 [Edhazardia aedis USNM 41457]|uniref:Transmembrane protein n=1 Tax=Edhazardia aedis (strain USNM 41457) TaxID=1003232 RepID=J9D6V3_EDHAE|nr:hypothetical protein EDEG_02162 [Edhazardia aedis USNM 41457]|eukprot:EJW03506.1 hypothetical protein EDEG_02162 [Edhazardia aedis USNM 41457]